MGCNKSWTEFVCKSMKISIMNFTFIHPNKVNEISEWKTKIKSSMFDKIKRWLNTSSVNKKRKCNKDEDYLKEATGEGVLENVQKGFIRHYVIVLVNRNMSGTFFMFIYILLLFFLSFIWKFKTGYNQSVYKLHI